MPPDAAHLPWQILWLFVLSIPVGCIAWTVTHKEVFREPPTIAKNAASNVAPSGSAILLPLHLRILPQPLHRGAVHRVNRFQIVIGRLDRLRARLFRPGLGGQFLHEPL